MKTLAQVLFCLVVLTIGRLSAQETFAPLITDNCVAFVHVDFSKVEIDKVKDAVQKLGEEVLLSLGFDDDSFKATARDLRIELEKLDAIVRPPFEAVTKELGVREFALIADLGLLERQVAALIAIPWDSKTDKQLETLRTVLQMENSVDEFLRIDGLPFLFLPLADHPVSAKKTVVEWFGEMESSTGSPIFDALTNVAGAEIKFAVTLPEHLRLLARSGGMPPDMPREIQAVLLFATQKIQWMSASLSLSNIVGGEMPKNSDVLLTIKTSKPEEAVLLRGMLEQAIEFGINTMRSVMDQDPSIEFPLPPLLFSFLKGFLRTLLPEVQDDRLLFRVSGDGPATKHIMAAYSAGGIGAAFLLPSIQASREAARRMQCSNNIKQIIIAFHNYHDTVMGLPPLYSVDKDGKPLHSWRVLILPWLEQRALFEQIRLDEPWDSEYNKQFHNVVIPDYSCPSNALSKPGQACCYAVIAGETFVPAAKEKAIIGNGFQHITDGTSNTIAIVEVKEPFCWMDPTADIDLATLERGINSKDGRCGSFHPGGCNVGMVDGSVRFFSQTLEKGNLRALGTRAGRENVYVP